MNNRRKLILAGAAVCGAPRLVFGQAKVRRIAWFGAGRGNTPTFPPYLDAFRAGLREAGWIDGQNLSLSLYLIEDTPEAAERLAREMLATNPEIIVVHGRDVSAVHRVKPACPVVFAFSGNPVDAGFVQSYARPGTNFTGISFLSLDLVGKRIELLKELAPSVRRLAVLARPEHPGEHRERAATEEVAGKLGLTLVYVPILAATGLDGALQAIARQNCDALIAFPDAVMLANRGRIAKFAAEAKIATVSGWGQFADSGFLLSYGPIFQDGFRRLGSYVDRILRGVKPGDLPVELPRTVELVLNARTARALGIKIPQSILVRADKVIE
jgi:putative ABC transport system substrate-binding protein